VKALVLSLALAVGAVSPLAAQTFPNKPVKLIVPAGPGSAPDIRARQLGAKLGEALGQPVVVENRPGGSMTIGAEAAARSAPDGYTLFLGNVVTHGINPYLFETLSYRPNEDFTPITLVSAGPLILVVNPQVPARTLAELMALARSQPARLNYGVVGQGSVAQLMMEQVRAASGAQFESVVYKSTGQYVQDLVAGHLQVSVNFWSVVGTNVRAGKLRALAVASARRLEVAPEIPTFAEAGLPGIEASGWQGVFVPAGTPRPIVNRLQTEIIRALKAPEVRNPIVDTGGEVGGSSPEEFAAFVRAEQVRWKKAIADAGMAPAARPLRSP
jgi:tripartite-type tricarboxylate transporter receptor subunit TctC